MLTIDRPHPFLSDLTTLGADAAVMLHTGDTVDTSPARCSEHGATLHRGPFGDIVCRHRGPVGPLTDPDPCVVHPLDIVGEPGEHIVTTARGDVLVVTARDSDDRPPAGNAAAFADRVRAWQAAR